MRNKSKIICVLAVIACLLQMLCVQALAALDGRVSFDGDAEKIIFSGTSNQAEQNVTLRIYNKTEEALVYVRQTKSDASANFRFEIPFSEIDAGNLEFIYNCEGNLTAKSVEKYFDKTKIEIPEQPGYGGGGGGNSGGNTANTSGGTNIIIPGGITQTPEPVKFAGYADVPQGHWAEESINTLTDKGVLNGISDTEFAPDAAVTREQFVKMIVAAFEIENIQEGTVPFADVQENTWYYDYVRTGFKYGIINGLDEMTFGVGEQITRQDACVVLHNAVKIFEIALNAEGKAPFADAEEIAPYARESVEMMYQAGIISGVGEDRFAPQDSLTRAMAAVLIDKTIQWR